MTVVHARPDEEMEHKSIRTTLYDLIEAINDEVAPEEEALVIATMMHLLSTGRIRFLRKEERPA
jgi:hypothetical protein